MTYRRMTITLREDEAEALFTMAEQARRYPKQQAQWIIAQAAVEAGLLKNEAGDAGTFHSSSTTRQTQTATA